MKRYLFEHADFMIAVTGDLTRNNAFAFAHNGEYGYPVGRRIHLVENWDQLLAALQR